MTDTAESKRINVAIFPSPGLGDGLIQLALANNLRRNGFKVTFYNDFIAEISAYIEDIDVARFPDIGLLPGCLGSAQLILYDSSSPFTRSLPAELGTWFARNGVCYSMTHARPVHRSVSPYDLQHRLPQGSKRLAHRFVRLNRSLRDAGIPWRRKPIVRQVVDKFCAILGLEAKTYANGLELPQPRDRVRAAGRVVIHPTSSQARKNWSEADYLQLARLLRSEGWEPAITVSPAERRHWAGIAPDIDVPEFPTIRHLADYYGEAAAFIGNDSGNAHLASCLGVPNIVIFGRRRRNPPWRPGWLLPRIVCSRTFAREGWQSSISVEHVYAEFRQLMASVAGGVHPRGAHGEYGERAEQPQPAPVSDRDAGPGAIGNV